MNHYSIIRVGNDYVVQANEKSVLKVASRRMASKLVAEASELLDLLSVQIAPKPDTEPSISRDQPKVP
jgi:hypothetical protein